MSYYKYFYSPKKDSLNAFLDDYSSSKRNELTVIQIGANDGITHDPIHKFIKRDNWQGVLIEPQLDVYTNYLSKIYQKNERIKTLCAAIGYEDGQQTLYKISFCEMRWATGLASFQKEKMEEAFISGSIEAQCLKYNVEYIPLPEGIATEKVRTISATTLIKEHDISTLDLLQIDTEGYDFEVIKIFDISKSNPKVIIFENTHLSEKDMNGCMQTLEQNNYKIRHFGGNTLAMKTPLENFSKYFS